MEPRQGDIILYPVTPKSGWTSRLVAAGEMALGIGNSLEAYSHAAILTEDGQEWEAKWPRIGKFPIDRTRIFEVWNVGNPTDDQRRAILLEAATHKGDWYNMTGLLSDGRLWIPHTEVCSQLVGICYKAGGIHLKKEGQRILAPNVIVDYPGARMVQRYYPHQRRLV